MKYTNPLFFLLILITSCQAQSNEVDLKVPDKVEIKKEGKHIQLPGTRVFIVTPAGYELVPKLIRLQKNKETYIQVIESATTSFVKQKSEILQAFQSAKEQGLQSYYEKEFLIGDDQAILVYGPDNKSAGEDELVLIFGNTESSVMVACKFPTGNKIDRKEIVSSLLTIYLDKNAKPDYSAFLNFTIDLSASDFKFNSCVSQLFYYTINGLGDPANDEFANDIMIMNLPPMNDLQAKKNYVASFLSNLERRVTILSHEEKEIIINGMSTDEMILSGTYKNKPMKAYLVIVGNSKSALLFCGIAYDNQDALFKQFTALAQTIKLK